MSFNLQINCQPMVLKLLFVFLLGLFLHHEVLAQKPSIVSVDRESSPLKGLITLKGSDFGTDPTKLKVFFGAAAADIQQVKNQLLEVKTPAGATYDNISVTNTTNGLIGYAPDQNFLNFNGTHGLATSNFASEVDIGAESGLYDLCLCDFNNDAKVDIATASDNFNSLAIFSNVSTVGSISLTKLSVLINAKSLHTTCGDLNGDGRPDIVVSEGAEGDRVYVFRNTGAMSFNVQSIKLTGRKVKRLVMADLDLNGKPELVVTDKAGNVISILPNQSTTTNIIFGAPVTFTVPGAISTDALEIKDINGNGLPEIITSQFLTASSNIFVCDNKSTQGVFNFSDITTLNVANTVINVRVGDLDGDHKPDIAATRLLGSDIAIFLNQSNANQISFSTPISVATSSHPWGLDLGDLDGDGKTDIAVASISNKSIIVLNNESTPGHLSFAAIAINTNFINRHVKIGDIDGDGKPDIAFTSVDDNNLNVPASKISVFRNTSCFVPTISPVGPVPICSGFPFKLNSSEGGGVMYDWKNNGSPVASGTNPALDITMSGTYTVTALSEGGSCSKISNAVDITVSAPPSSLTGTPIAESNTPVCVKEALNLKINDVGATEYRWTGPNGFSATGRTPTLNNFSLLNAGTYTVDLVVGTCITSSVTTLVEGVANPDFKVNFSGSSLICQGTTKALSISPLVTSGFTFQWFEKNIGALPGETNSTFTVSSSGEYSARVISNFPGCSPVETPAVKITVVSVPNAAYTPSVITTCVGQVVTFANQSTFDALTTPFYNWTFGDGQTSTNASPTNTYTQAGTFQAKLKVTYQGESCPDEEIKSIKVVSAPLVNITNPDNRFSMCPNDTVRLEVLGDFVSYLWNTGATSSFILVNEAKEYSVTVVTPAGCTIEKKKNVVSFGAPPVNAFADHTNIKAGQTTQLSATGLEAYKWKPGVALSDSTIENPIAAPLQTITYTVSGVDVNGCKGEASVRIDVFGPSAMDLIFPKIYFSPNDDMINPYWAIENIDNFPQCAVIVYNDKGTKVFEAKPYVNNVSSWDGTYKGSKLPEGVYYYLIRCDDEAQVKTGSITLLK
jgi:gliding motility-associated-like protein